MHTFILLFHKMRHVVQTIVIRIIGSRELMNRYLLMNANERFAVRQRFAKQWCVEDRYELFVIALHSGLITSSIVRAMLSKQSDDGHMKSKQCVALILTGSFIHRILMYAAGDPDVRIWSFTKDNQLLWSSIDFVRSYIAWLNTWLPQRMNKEQKHILNRVDAKLRRFKVIQALVWDCSNDRLSRTAEQLKHIVLYLRANVVSDHEKQLVLDIASLARDLSLVENESS